VLRKQEMGDLAEDAARCTGRAALGPVAFPHAAA
jgi:hypothetical protein